LVEGQQFLLSGAKVEDIDEIEYNTCNFGLTVSASHGTFASSDILVSLLMQSSSIMHSKTSPDFISSTIEHFKIVTEKRFSDDSFYVQINGENVSFISISDINYSNNYETVNSQYRTIHLQSSSSDELNYFMSKIYYLPENYFNGKYMISISICESCPSIPTNDLAFTTNLIPIFIRAINNAPVWTFPFVSITSFEDISFSFDGDIALNDVYSGNSSLFASIFVDVGALSLPFIPYNITLINGTGENDQYFSILGNLNDINYVLKYMIYHPD
jgi:hypothetical protein